jgi:hypothetical protein
MQKPGFFGMNGFLLFLLTCWPFFLQAQQGGSLILIDAENKLPFTVRIGDQLFASSGHGHLVIAHLKDSNYRLGIRFPKKVLAEQVFPVIVKQKDLGFQLQGSDSSWTLYNWQAKIAIRPVKDRDSSRILEMGTKREDGFSKLMAAVVDDTAVNYNTYTGNWFTKDSLSQAANTTAPLSGALTANGSQIRQSITKPEANGPAGKTVEKPSPVNPLQAKIPDTTVNKNAKPAAAAKVAAISATQKAGGTAIQPGIKKLREVNLKISRKMVFLDTGPDGVRDTVTLFVFFETGDSAKKQVNDLTGTKKKSAVPDSTDILKTQAKNAGADVFVPGCGEQATAGDLEWLRSAILKANAEQDKINAASAAFALKCFSVSQLRVLASLFVSDKARYRLMEAARLHISDRAHFRELADMYTDKNFQRKFLVMADKRS